mmetsp:Transcript_38794/g.50199  ORF Transcript_38794/g.50199 Transcript_38794/m.50199 type:complete len:329 (+) Transcript_38794:1337-2323(+)
MMSTGLKMMMTTMMSLLYHPLRRQSNQDLFLARRVRWMLSLMVMMMTTTPLLPIQKLVGQIMMMTMMRVNLDSVQKIKAPPVQVLLLVFVVQVWILLKLIREIKWLHYFKGNWEHHHHLNHRSLLKRSVEEVLMFQILMALIRLLVSPSLLKLVIPCLELVKVTVICLEAWEMMIPMDSSVRPNLLRLSQNHLLTRQITTMISHLCLVVVMMMMTWDLPLILLQTLTMVSKLLLVEQSLIHLFCLEMMMMMICSVALVHLPHLLQPKPHQNLFQVSLVVDSSVMMTTMTTPCLVEVVQVSQLILHHQLWRSQRNRLRRSLSAVKACPV